MDFSIGAIVYKIQNKQSFYLLVLAADRTYWGFPKGHPEKNEFPKETALREIYEETGHNVEIDVNFNYDMRYILPNGEEKIVKLFLAENISEDPIIFPNEEIAEIRWFLYDDAIKIMKFEDTKQALKKAHVYVCNELLCYET